MDKQNFYDLNFDQLKNFLIEKAEVDNKKAKMRSQQMFNAVYKKNIKSFDELTTFGLELREKIKNLILNYEAFFFQMPRKIQILQITNQKTLTKLDKWGK